MSNTTHSIPQFHEAMVQLHREALEVGQLVKTHLEGALEALRSGDVKRAQQISDNDEKVDRLEKRIDKECAEVLAKHSPVAADLRMVIVLMKTITDLERIGDEASRIAAQTNGDHPIPSDISDGIAALGKKVLASLDQLLHNFEHMDMVHRDPDPNKARDLAAADKEINRQAHELIRTALASGMGDTLDEAQDRLALIWCVRSLERIGDHVKNVSQYLVYFAEGVDIRHASSGRRQTT